MRITRVRFEPTIFGILEQCLKSTTIRSHLPSFIFLYIQRNSTVEIWVRTLAGYEEYALLFLNKGSKPKTVNVSLKELGFTFRPGFEFEDALDHGKFIGVFDTIKYYNFTVPESGVLLYNLYFSS